jgi:hypothetical protein
MRTTLVATVIVALSAGAAAAQQSQTKSSVMPLFQTSTTYAGPRVWLGNLNGAVAFGGQAERGMTKPEQYGPGVISAGFGVDYYSWDFDYAFGKYAYSVVPLQAFSNYHFVVGSNPKIDPYVGLALVYSIVNATWEGSGTAAAADASSLAFAGQAGVRYFLTEKFALQGQFGFGYGTLGIGTTWRF